MRVNEIYEARHIMPGLALHQLRVAAVGKMICENLDQPIDENSIVLACLFHDMANIIKSDLVSFPEFLGDKGFDYWSAIKNEMIERYGDVEHHACIAIGREIGLPENVLTLINGVGFGNLETTRDGTSLEQKIVEYADLRVSPYGITSLIERAAEAKARYAKRRQALGRTEEKYQRLLEAAIEIERQIFERCTISPTDITEGKAVTHIETLREREIETSL